MLPAGIPFNLRKYAVTSAYSAGVMEPGVASGMVVRIWSNRSNTVRPFHLRRKSALDMSFRV